MSFLCQSKSYLALLNCFLQYYMALSLLSSHSEYKHDDWSCGSPLITTRETQERPQSWHSWWANSGDWLHLRVPSYTRKNNLSHRYHVPCYLWPHSMLAQTLDCLLSLCWPGHPKISYISLPGVITQTLQPGTQVILPSHTLLCAAETPKTPPAMPMQVIPHLIHTGKSDRSRSPTE